MVLLYLQVTSNEKQNTLWRPADKPIRKDQQDRFFWLQDYRFFLNQLRQLSAISCCKRLPSIGSVTHWITRGKKKQHGSAESDENKLAMNGIESFSMPKPSISICLRSWLHHHLHPPKPTIQRIFNIQPTLQTQLMLYSLSLYPWVPWVLPE